MKIIHTIAYALVIIGGLNWGLSALNYNVVDMILGPGSQAAKIVYLLVGIAAIIEVATHKHNCRMCNSSSSTAPAQM